MAPKSGKQHWARQCDDGLTMAVCRSNYLNPLASFEEGVLHSCRTNVKMIVVALVLMVVSACGGTTAGGKSAGVVDGRAPLPPHATAKVKANHGKCKKGDPIACDWVGVWFLVGGGGQDNVSRAQTYFKFACDHGYRRGCVHLQQMEQGDQGM